MSIINLLNQIKNEEIVLPAIQRDFVWPQDKVVRLLDSVMRGYPIGLCLLWETYEDIQYRAFVKDYRGGNLYTYRENTDRRKIKVVLDGQQRLQSLYLALYGTLEGKSLYFDVLSGEESDDVAEEKFFFSFADADHASKRNDKAIERASEADEGGSDNGRREHLVRISDLFRKGAREKKDLVRELSRTLHLSEDAQLRVDLNLSKIDEVLTKDENILRVSVIDEDLPNESPSRKSEADVLEIFVRVNREGTPLSRSDLIFSMLKLNWKESAEALPEFVRTVNEGNSFDLDTDFVIRCLFAVSDLGAKFDLDLLRKKSNVTSLRGNFSECCDAIRATVDFVQKECWCQSSQVIGGASTLVPFVYYLFHTGNHEVPNSEVGSLRKALYLLGFAKPFSRYGDSRLGAFIRQDLKPLVEDGDESFPLDAVVSWIGYWEKIRALDNDLLDANHLLTLHVVQGLTGAKVQYVRNKPEIDHIFPRSVLREKGYDEALINHFANFWILAKGKNQNKSNRHPADYFEDVDDEELQRALIDREYLDYRRYTTFIERRSEQMLDRVRRKLQLSDKDFAVYEDDED